MKKLYTLIFLLLTVIPIAGSIAQVRLPQIIRDGMVLQRDSKLTIWGWASPGERVTITLDDKHYRADRKRLVEDGI